jgi:phage virion morphogenesis protein
MVSFRINDAEFRLKLRNFVQRVGPGPLLRVAGAAMQSSIMQTFREEGSPAGSWAPLAASTLKKYGKKGPGHKLLVMSGRLRNSITQKVDGNRLLIGSNVIYARIHQLGGAAGRSHASKIPARPYLVFRPEDPARIAKAMDVFIDDAIRKEGLK